METKELDTLLPYTIKGLTFDGIRRNKNGKWAVYYLNKYHAVAISAINYNLETAVLEIRKKLNEYQS